MLFQSCHSNAVSMCAVFAANILSTLDYTQQTQQIKWNKTVGWSCFFGILIQFYFDFSLLTQMARSQPNGCVYAMFEG